MRNKKKRFDSFIEFRTLYSKDSNKYIQYIVQNCFTLFTLYSKGRSRKKHTHSESACTSKRLNIHNTNNQQIKYNIVILFLRFVSLRFCFFLLSNLIFLQTIDRPSIRYSIEYLCRFGWNVLFF